MLYASNVTFAEEAKGSTRAVVGRLCRWAKSDSLGWVGLVRETLGMGVGLAMVSVGLARVSRLSLLVAAGMSSIRVLFGWQVGVPSLALSPSRRG